MKIAVIPARGGSKRIPKKNIRLFMGKPIIAHSIELALRSGLFDKVIVSTDNQEIAEVGQRYGAEVPFLRPAELADDHSVLMEVMKHALAWYEDRGQSVSTICCIFATAPLMDLTDLERGLQVLMNGEADIAMSVTSFAYPIQRALKLDREGYCEMFQPEYAKTRSQDLEAAYHEAAQFVWFSKQAVAGTLVTSRNKGICVPRYRVQDIDTEEDWVMAELIAKALFETEQKGIE